MVMTLYDRFICIKDMDEKETWYKVEKEDIDELKKVFIVPGEETSADGKEGGRGFRGRGKSPMRRR